MAISNIIGNKYGKLTVIKYLEYGAVYNYYLCKCDCGNEKIVRQDSLITGRTKSCGCIKKGENIIMEKNVNIVNEIIWSPGYFERMLHMEPQLNQTAISFIKELIKIRDVYNGDVEKLSGISLLSILKDLSTENMTTQEVLSMKAILMNISELYAPDVKNEDNEFEDTLFKNIQNIFANLNELDSKMISYNNLKHLTRSPEKFKIDITTTNVNNEDVDMTDIVEGAKARKILIKENKNGIYNL